MRDSSYRRWLERGDPTDLAPELAELLPTLAGRARRLLGNHADAEDAVQDALLAMLLARARLPTALPCGQIAHRLVQQHALMHARRRARQRRRSRPLTPELPAADQLNDVEVEPLRAYLHALPHRERTILLRLAEGTAMAEIAAVCGVTANHAAVLIHRARAKMRVGLGRG